MEDKVFPECWIFNTNRRKYVEGISRPVWRYHWQKLEIVSETKVSWVTNYGIKIPKKGRHDICFSEKEIDDLEYIHNNSYKISREVSQLKDPSILRKIEELLNGRA